MKPKLVDAPNNLKFKVTERIYRDMTTPVHEKKFPLPRVIAIIIQKGGTGKTTLTVNLGGALAQKGKRVLMVDLDHQGNLSLTFGKREEDVVGNTIYEVLLMEKEISEVMLEVANNLFLVPACVSLNGLETDLAKQQGPDIRLLTQLQPILEYFDYILLDCAPAMNKAVFNAMVAATDIIVPWNPDLYATEGVVNFFKNLAMTARFHDKSMGRFNGILINRVDKNLERTKLARAMTLTIEEDFPGQVFKTVIPRNIKMEEATARRGTILEHAPNSPGSEAILALADEIIAQEETHG